jgi:hypothetical protein
MEEIVNIVSTLGFPMAVAIWAMLVSRKDKEWLQNTLNEKLDGISGGITEMTKSIERFENAFKESKR